MTIELPDIAQGTSVPRRLHHVFLDGWAAMPDVFRQTVEATRAHNPGWQATFWDAGRGERFIAETYGRRVLDIYRSLDPRYYAARGDLLRYLILHALGGVYLDVKSIADRPLDDVLRPEDSYWLCQFPLARDRLAAQSHYAELRHVPGGEYCQWVIVSAPGHPFLAAVLRDVLRNVAQYDPLRAGVGGMGVIRTTGPIAYTRAIHPIRPAHPHRYVLLEEVGLRYTVLGDVIGHHRTQRRHYSRHLAPLVPQGRLVTLAAAIRFGPTEHLRFSLNLLWGLRVRPALRRSRQRVERSLRQGKRRLLGEPPLPPPVQRPVPWRPRMPDD